MSIYLYRVVCGTWLEGRGKEGEVGWRSLWLLS